MQKAVFRTLATSKAPALCKLSVKHGATPCPFLKGAPTNVSLVVVTRVILARTREHGQSWNACVNTIAAPLRERFTWVEIISRLLRFRTILQLHHRPPSLWTCDAILCSGTRRILENSFLNCSQIEETYLHAHTYSSPPPPRSPS